MQLALPCPLHGICSPTECNSACCSLGCQWHHRWGSTARSYPWRSAASWLLHHYFWCLKFHFKRRLWALRKLLLLPAICKVVFAHWLYCQMSLLVLCASKKPPCCGFQVCWRSLAESVFPISIAQSNAHIPRLRQESHCSLSPTPACRGDSAVLSASTQLIMHPLHVGLFPPRNALSAHFSHIFHQSFYLSRECQNLQEEFRNEVQLILCLLFGV